MLEKKIQLALSHPGSFSFDGNEASASSILDRLVQMKKTKQNGATLFHIQDAPSIANTRVKVYPTGHMAFYNDEGRRFLGTDPGGHPLHEAKWSKNPSTGGTCLEAARMQLDALQWVGIRPQARTFQSQIDIFNIMDSDNDGLVIVLLTIHFFCENLCIRMCSSKFSDHSPLLTQIYIYTKSYRGEGALSFSCCY